MHTNQLYGCFLKMSLQIPCICLSREAVSSKMVQKICEEYQHAITLLSRDLIIFSIIDCRKHCLHLTIAHFDHQRWKYRNLNHCTVFLWLPALLHFTACQSCRMLKTCIYSICVNWEVQSVYISLFTCSSSPPQTVTSTHNNTTLLKHYFSDVH